MSFLSEIQGKFQGTYSGRYIASILAELFRQDPNAFANVLAAAGVKYRHSTSHSIRANGYEFFGIANRRRFADLAVVDATESPLVLIEIKDADVKVAGNTAQISDYLAFIEREAKDKRRVEFLFLSRTVPPEHDELKLERSKNIKQVHRMLFGELYEPLEAGKPFALMIRDYLEDIGVAYYGKRPDRNTIQYVTKLMFNSGGPFAAERSVREFFDTVFSNLNSIGLWIQNRNPKLFKQGFKRRIYVEPLARREAIAASPRQIQE